MSDDSNGVETKTENQVEDNEEGEMSKCKKIKISDDVAEQLDSKENEATKSDISDALKETEHTDLTINSENSSTNNSDLVVNNADTSTDNFDITNNKCEQVESASSNVNSANSELEITDANKDTLKQSSNNDNAEVEQLDSINQDDNQINTANLAVVESEENESSECTDLVCDNEKIATTASQDDNQLNESDPSVIKAENESSKYSTDIVCDNEKVPITQADSNETCAETKTSANFLKEETLYELLNNPMDVQDDSSINSNEKTEVSAASNGNFDKIDSTIVQDKRVSPEIQKNDEITCQELLDILQEKDKKLKKKVLIIDVRNEEEYCKSRMSFYDNIINIPAEKIQANKVPGYYRYILLCDIEAEKKFSRRSHNDIIVLVDKNSELKTMASDSKIAVFKNSLEEYDVHIDYKRIAVLKGGFEEWTNLYPDFVTKS